MKSHQPHVNGLGLNRVRNDRPGRGGEQKTAEKNKMKKNSAIIFVLISCLFLICGCNNDNALFPIETNGKWGYIDKSGTIVITPQWNEAESFSEGLARVSVDGKYGYINSNGEYVIKPQFDFAGDFSEGMAPVSIGDMYGYINNKGKYLINPQFEEAYSFSNGLASVRIGNNFGCINKEGEIYHQSTI